MLLLLLLLMKNRFYLVCVSLLGSMNVASPLLLCIFPDRHDKKVALYFAGEKRASERTNESSKKKKKKKSYVSMAKGKERNEPSKNEQSRMEKRKS